ncbi:heavy-metal-associated domain-containing protein [Fodinibius halophilus]|uniref:Heavy-metal-associated domain-containing protein n=1 Tax=Fodinibius halophilus TaxID=1736908 RepID=A0A6M1T3N4_9BACT|nr:heavy-metal-associated domain-containing protein [Fodinibius halophilus]NGP90036.1 heavy-metal-associated domain-containing protein [Fodinibius halophilus]
MDTLKFNIPDLHCGGCADRSAEILEELEGVKQATVSIDDKSAEVSYNPEQASFNTFKEALAEANYTAEK